LIKEHLSSLRMLRSGKRGLEAMEGGADASTSKRSKKSGPVRF
jgi:hypothetical protein